MLVTFLFPHTPHHLPFCSDGGGSGLDDVVVSRHGGYRGSGSAALPRTVNRWSDSRNLRQGHVKLMPGALSSMPPPPSLLLRVLGNLSIP